MDRIQSLPGIAKVAIAAMHRDGVPAVEISDFLKIPLPLVVSVAGAEKGRFTLGQILDAVSRVSHISRAELSGRTRSEASVVWRIVYAILAKEEGYHFTVIGRCLGSRDHSSISHLINKASQSPVYRNDVARGVASVTAVLKGQAHAA